MGAVAKRTLPGFSVSIPTKLPLVISGLSPTGLPAAHAGALRKGMVPFGATIAVGSNVDFPRNGPSSESGLIARIDADTFNLTAIGVYQIFFQVSINEAGQLVLTLDSGSGPLELPYTVVGRATGTSQITGVALVQTTTSNSVLSVSNPAGNSTALTVTPLAGGTSPVSAHLLITQIQ